MLDLAELSAGDVPPDERRQKLLAQWDELHSQYPDSPLAVAEMLEVVCDKSISGSDLPWTEVLDWLLTKAGASPNAVCVFSSKRSLLFHVLQQAGHYPRKTILMDLLELLLSKGAHFSAELDAGSLAPLLLHLHHPTLELLEKHQATCLRPEVDPNSINLNHDSLLHALVREKQLMSPSQFQTYANVIQQEHSLFMQAIHTCCMLGADPLSRNSADQLPSDVLQEKLITLQHIWGTSDSHIPLPVQAMQDLLAHLLQLEDHCRYASAAL